METAAAAAALKQQPSSATQWISFYKLTDDLFGKISAASLQMSLPAITRHLLQFQMTESCVDRLLLWENIGTEDGIE